MEQHESTNSGSFAELPQPQEVSGQEVPEQGSGAQPETRGMQAPSARPSGQQPDPAMPLDPQALQPIGTTTPASAPDANAYTAALMADDADLIEKEWVTRAKAIVMHTKDDPHAQNREMNKVKADYLKKRYNKDLKTTES